MVLLGTSTYHSSISLILIYGRDCIHNARLTSLHVRLQARPGLGSKYTCTRSLVLAFHRANAYT